MGAMVAQWHCATQPLQREGVIPEEFSSAFATKTPDGWIYATGVLQGWQ